jgi:hypothetical protein
MMIMDGSMSICTRGLFDKNDGTVISLRRMFYSNIYVNFSLVLVFRFKDQRIRWIPVDFKSISTKEEYQKKKKSASANP